MSRYQTPLSKMGQTQNSFMNCNYSITCNNKFKIILLWN